jgi:hypothetical protein
MQITKSSPSSAKKSVRKTANGAHQERSDAESRSEIRHEEIAKLAARFYFESGCQEGRDAENWLQAEHTLRQQEAGRADSAPPRP